MTVLCICPNPSVDTFLWIDRIRMGGVTRALQEKHFPGGKGTHVALACAETDQETTLLGFWGGPSGEWIRKECSGYGIRSQGVQVEGWSRTCLSFKSPGESDDTEILGVGPSIRRKEQLLFEQQFESLVRSARCVSMSGSWPEGSSADGYARLIQISHRRKVPVFLDCTGEQLKNAMKARPYAIHLNAKEAGDVFGENEPGRLAAELAGHCSIAAVTDGKEGLYLSDGQENLHGKVTLPHCHSAVGSGDCLLAGLMVAFLQRKSLSDTVRTGVAYGAANCLREELGMLRRSDAEALFGQVVLKRI